MIEFLRLKSVLAQGSGPAPTGIYNPVINPTIGTGKGEEIIALLFANILKVFFIVTGLLLLVQLLWSGIDWLKSGSDKEALANAQRRITHAIAGFIIFFSVFAIINFLAPVLGLEFLQVLKIEWPTP